LIPMAAFAISMLGGLYVKSHVVGHGRAARQVGVRHAIVRGATNAVRSLGGNTPMSILDQFIENTSAWVPYPGDGLVPGARQIPIVARNFLPLTPGQVLPGPGEVVHGNRKWYGSYDLYLEFKGTAKAALAAAGRDNEDWRCSIFRWAMETLWGTECTNFNAGNIHGRPWASSDSVRAGHVWTDQIYPSGAVVMPDDGRIIVEYAFPDLAEYCKHELAWYQRNGYQGVLAGNQVGDLAGLQASSRTAMAKGYAASGTTQEDLIAAGQFWARGQRVLGADWSR
jgi:hypothetical protein